MARFLTFFALMLSIIGSATHPAEAAHPAVAEAASVVHDGGYQHIDSHDDDQQGDQSDDGVVHHHHCPNAWISGASPRIEAISCEEGTPVAAAQATLRSRADDPLLEPPAA